MPRSAEIKSKEGGLGKNRGRGHSSGQLGVKDNVFWRLKEMALNMEDEDDIVPEGGDNTLVETSVSSVQCADKEKGTCKIDTWGEFKKALTKQFYPKNVEFEMYHKMRRLRHTGSLLEYAKEYLMTILELPDMADRNALNGFNSGLQL
ncbi:hypothetical protein RJ640_001213 [Escallonia rubra]|uniref:Retrotransposon gag domain-containing protein n=1 Tax=Escallonia rubra TaxID=112253 RepID=A0AA88RX09_9ASTE|nr:hypothetical protein RJ640_001213 [Escallonia rubra]